MYPEAAPVSYLTKPFSIYIHIPFCIKKCAYCSFYSVAASDEMQKAYCDKIIGELKKRGGQTTRPVCSVYFGGGTPSLLKTEYLTAILRAVFDNFNVENDAEITLEANPADDMGKMLFALRKAGFNRISFGVQSANESELKLLGRRHTANDAEKAVKAARKAGFNNISLDLMIGLPESNFETLKTSLDFVTELRPQHISAYILKLEENTPLYLNAENLRMPDDDTTAYQYHYMCSYLKTKGYSHYEISNFAKPGFESRHNNSYWTLRDYLGFGPSAHSFFEGRRFYYENDLKKYLDCPTEIFDGEGGTAEEYIMLGLRLKSGISESRYKELYGVGFSENFKKKAELLAKNGLLTLNGDTVTLTERGMLVSNSIIAELEE